MSGPSKPSNTSGVKKSPQPKGPGGGVKVNMDDLKQRVAKQGNNRYKGGGRTPSKAFLAASARWRSHLAEYRKAYPNMSLKQQMRGAKKTYKKSKSQPVSVQVKSKPNRTKRKVKRTKRRTGKKKRTTFSLF